MVEEYPKNLTELEAAFATEESCRAYFGPPAMAGWFPVSALRWWQVLACARRPAGVCSVWRPNIRDRRDHFPGHADAIARLVSRHVVGDDPEERRQRVRVAASAGVKEL